MKLRILFAIHGPADPQTAVYLNVEQRARYLRLEGHHIDILTADALRHQKWARIDPIVLPLKLLRRGLSAYDVVIFHSYMGWAFHAARRWCDPDGHVTSITAFHGLEPIYYRALSEELERAGKSLSLRFRLLHNVVLPRLLRASCRASSAVFCLNRAEIEYVTKHRWAERQHVHLVANGVDADFFVEPQQRSPARRLLFIGQWLPAKGIRYLVRAFSELAERRDVALSCVGTGLQSDIVRNAFPEHVRSRVTVMPRAERTQIREELSRADVFVFPSLSEGFSGALLEAMAAGRAIVATPVGAAADLLEHDKNAVVVPCADAVALVAGVTRLLDHTSLRERLGRAAHQIARRYEWNYTSAQFSAGVTDAVVRRLITVGRPPLASDNAIS
jgi:glycosyltransferase involved in cell wall biosynthesis